MNVTQAFAGFEYMGCSMKENYSMQIMQLALKQQTRKQGHSTC